MGTQQILMIVLSVIIVGTAIAVGIQMFDEYYESTRREQGIIEMYRISGMVAAWYRTPVAMGGGGNGKNLDGTPRLANLDEIAKYLNSNYTPNGSWRTWTTVQGTFAIDPNGTTLLGNDGVIRLRLYYVTYGQAPYTGIVFKLDGTLQGVNHITQVY